MNYRSKTTAMTLCFFLGWVGAHWFYLGRPRWGGFYVTGVLAPWPVALYLLLLPDPIGPALGGTALVMAWLAQLGLGVMVFVDFFTLLSLDPRRFDALYNG